MARPPKHAATGDADNAVEILQSRAVTLATMSIAAALAVAAVSLGWLSPPKGGPSTGPTFTYTPPAPSAQATATLAKLGTPAGLTRGACAQPPGNDDTLCFRTRQSIVPTSSAITRLIDALGKCQQEPNCAPVSGAE